MKLQALEEAGSGTQTSNVEREERKRLCLVNNQVGWEIRQLFMGREMTRRCVLLQMVLDGRSGICGMSSQCCAGDKQVKRVEATLHTVRTLYTWSGPLCEPITSTYLIVRRFRCVGISWNIVCLIEN